MREWRALTVRPPWSWAIAHGGKHVENRTGGPDRWRYRGSVMIHAGQQWSTRGEVDPRVKRAWRVVYPGTGVTAGRPLIYRPGSVVAVAELVEVHGACGCCKPWGEDSYEEAAGRRRTDITHLILDDVRPVYTTVEARGRLGLWYPGPELVAAVEACFAAGGKQLYER